MVREIRGMGMEVCTTLGMLSPEEAKQLKEAGLTAYNHNLDTSREYYPEVGAAHLWRTILRHRHENSRCLTGNHHTVL
jgi:biotin synthase-like enzyme